MDLPGNLSEEVSATIFHASLGKPRRALILQASRLIYEQKIEQ
jgi:hypothetical protein